jgi:hypothetical protein
MVELPHHRHRSDQSSAITRTGPCLLRSCLRPPLPVEPAALRAHAVSLFLPRWEQGHHPAAGVTSSRRRPSAGQHLSPLRGVLPLERFRSRRLFPFAAAVVWLLGLVSSAPSAGLAQLRLGDRESQLSQLLSPQARVRAADSAGFSASSRPLRGQVGGAAAERARRASSSSSSLMGAGSSSRQQQLSARRPSVSQHRLSARQPP